MIAVDSLPAELVALDRWVLWRPRQRNGKTTKVPYQAANPDREASTTDSRTWMTFTTAFEASRTTGLGMGVVLGNGLLGIDLDDCINGEGLHREAQRIVEECGSYAERSPSGTGVHVYSFAELNGHGNRGTGPWDGNFEIYDRGRFLTVTGNQLDGTPDEVTNGHQEAIDSICERVFAHTGDEKIVRRARSSKDAVKFAALFDDGDTSGYDSPSEADLALCNIVARFTKDREQIGRLVGRSALMDGKWDRERLPSADHRQGAV